MEKAFTFGGKCIVKTKFHMCELPISIDKLNIEKIVLSNKESCK